MNKFCTQILSSLGDFLPVQLSLSLSLSLSFNSSLVFPSHPQISMNAPLAGITAMATQPALTPSAVSAVPAEMGTLEAEPTAPVSTGTHQIKKVPQWLFLIAVYPLFQSLFLSWRSLMFVFCVRARNNAHGLTELFSQSFPDSTTCSLSHSLPLLSTLWYYVWLSWSVMGQSFPFAIQHTKRRTLLYWRRWNVDELIARNVLKNIFSVLGGQWTLTFSLFAICTCQCHTTIGSCCFASVSVIELTH